MLPVQEMKDSTLVASDALNKVLAVTGGGLIAVLVIISTFGAVNGNVLPCARIQFAMGQEGYFFKRIGKVHGRYHTPGNALLLQAIWACLFVLTGSFDMLTDVFVFVTWLFYGFAAYGLFILRKKMPEAQRSYRVWGYPIIPVVFILFAAFYFFLTLYNDIISYARGEKEFINSVYGLALTAAGIPLYWYFSRKNKNSTY
jgi:APA family basic amino acid/polyamine antiporter